jgi:tRNA nucleotidyltransferase (CCA-adding enzyme)
VTSLRTILASASKLVTPSAREETSLEQTAKKMLTRVEVASSRFKEVRGVHLGGSFAKGTWLPGDVDLDIFVRIADNVGAQRFEQIGLSLGEEAVRGYPHGKKYAQHPYTEATVDGVRVNIVPCYDVKPGKWKSAADRSLYHVEFVKENMGEKDRRQVRLLKRFMKTVGVYGAEIENEGFSGYASEVLVYLNANFEGVLTYFADLKFEGEKQLSLKDPVDPQRELATAISKETVARLVLASRVFLDGPELAYFKRVRSKVNKALERRLYCIRFDHAALSEDTLWGELKKSARQLVKHVEAQGFVIARAAPISNGSDRSAIVLLPEFDVLPEMVERQGPSVDLADEVKRFVLKNRDKAELIWASQDGRIHILQRRKFTKLGKLLEELCGREIRRVGASRDIAPSIERTGRVLTGAAIAAERASENWFGTGVDSIVTYTIGTDSH